MKPGKAMPFLKPPAQPQERVHLAVLFCIVALGYLITFSGSRYGRVGDGKKMFATALSIYEFNELAIPNIDPSQSAQAGHKIHSGYGIGFPLVLQIP